MFWFRKKRPEGADTAAPLLDRIVALEVELAGLKRSLDDLDDSFRSFRGRRFKQEAREAVTEGAEPPAPSDAGGSVHLLKKAGRWPWR